MKTATIAAAATTALLAFTPTLSWATDTTSNQYPGGITQRIAGKNRIATNYQLIKQKYGNQPVGHAYIARADLGADALSAAPLATKDPILLVDPNQAPIDTINQQIKPLGVTEVTVIGGNQAMPQRYVDTLGVKTRERLAGKDRYETNLTVIKKAYPTPQTIFVVNGDGMVDTIAATATAMTQYGSLMLASGKGYTANQEAYIESNKNCTVTSIGNAPTYPTRNHRISQIGYSQTPEQVSALVAKQTYPSGNNKFYLANSTVLADAISAGIIKDGPVLLVNPAKHPTEALLAAKDLKATHITALGGETAIPQKLLDLFGIKTIAREKPQTQGEKQKQPIQKTNETRKQNHNTPTSDSTPKYDTKNPATTGIFSNEEYTSDKIDNWQDPDAWVDFLKARINGDWAHYGKYDNTTQNAIHYDPALNQAAKTGEGTAGMIMMCSKRPGIPANVFSVNHRNIEVCKGNPDSFFLQEGDKVETATGIYIIDRVSFGVTQTEKPKNNVSGWKPNQILLSPTFLFKYEGHPQGGGDTAMLDESGFIKAYHFVPKSIINHEHWETIDIDK